ncbi:MAG: GNAT family N-acetyltransferase [Alphaproteobacteria bacterium]|nr:GNAT family N-acetyltransferase [Alphaproteobacteria bacterium]
MPNTPVVIRPFEAGDLPRLQEIRAAAFAPVFASFRSLVGDELYALALSRSDAEQADLLESLCAPASTAEVFVAMHDAGIIGFVSLTLDATRLTGEIGLNAVHPDAAGEGVGQQLYEFALDRMKAAGMKAATVSTGGDASHAPARRAYEKAGFAASVPSLWMVRSL